MREIPGKSGRVGNSELCAERCPELTPNAEFICRTFAKLFGLLHSATLWMIVVNSSLTQTWKSYVSTNTDFITNHNYSLSLL